MPNRRTFLARVGGALAAVAAGVPLIGPRLTVLLGPAVYRAEQVSRIIAANRGVRIVSAHFNPETGLMRLKEAITRLD